MERMSEAQWAQAETFRQQLELQRQKARQRLEEKRELDLAKNSFQAARGLLDFEKGYLEGKKEPISKDGPIALNA